MNTQIERISEEELIAYQMGECSKLRAWQIKRAIERDPALAEVAAHIAATLRAFADEPAPVATSEMLDRMWGNVRPSMAVLEPQPRPVHAWKMWGAALVGTVAGAVLVLTVITHVHVVHEGHTQSAQNHPAVVAPVPEDQPLRTASVTEAQHEIEQYKEGAKSTDSHPAYYHGRPGPVTQTPEDIVATETGLAGHLDRSQRLLTEVSNEDGPMPAVTRREAHRLLLENAVYQERARSEGDYAAAEVMDHLGRALTSLDADPPKTASSVDAFRLEFNIGGVMFDMRVLHDEQEKKQ